MNDQEINGGDDELNDDDAQLLLEAASFAGRYARGVLPGTDPIEILTGLHLGLTPGQLDAVESDPRLRALVRKHWDDEGVDEVLWRLAAGDDEIGRRHTALLASCGYPHPVPAVQDEIERFLWLLLDEAPQAASTKGDSFAETDRWTLRCDPLRCLIVVLTRADAYDIRFVPEVGVEGGGRILARWDDETVDAIDVELTARELVEVRLPRLGRRLVALAVDLPNPPAEG